MAAMPSLRGLDLEGALLPIADDTPEILQRICAIADDLDPNAKLNAPLSRGSSREDRRGAFLTLGACERSFSGP